ncbi:Tsp42Ej, partial [Drosophila busckii]
FDCCGDSGYQDYSNTQIVPGTCCGYTNANAACPASIYTMRPGCNAKFVSFWSDNTNLIRWAGLGICIYEFIVFFLAGILAK